MREQFIVLMTLTLSFQVRVTFAASSSASTCSSVYFVWRVHHWINDDISQQTCSTSDDCGRKFTSVSSFRGQVVVVRGICLLLALTTQSNFKVTHLYNMLCVQMVFVIQTCKPLQTTVCSLYCLLQLCCSCSRCCQVFEAEFCDVHLVSRKSDQFLQTFHRSSRKSM